MVRVDRRTGKRVFSGYPTDNPLSDIIWEAFKPDTEPSRSTRADLIAARRAEYLALIAAGRYGDSATREVGMPENFAEESGGIY